MSPPVITFHSDTHDVSRQGPADRPHFVVRTSGSVHLQMDQEYQVLTAGTPVLYPRQASVFKTSSLEVYGSVRFKNLRARRSLTSQQLSTSSDSWTHISIGVGSQAFVTLPFSASQHEVTVLGAFRSGSQAIGVGPVPATASLFYEKQTSLRKATWKWVATASMGGFTAARGQLIAASASVFAPHVVSIDAPAGGDDGRIVDVKVWVELLQMSGSGFHPALGQIGVAVRNPLLGWGHAHPIRNFSAGLRFNDGLDVEPGLDVYWRSSGSIPAFYQDTFLLWEGGALFRSSARTPYANPVYPTIDTPFYCPVWDRDIGMRTVFCDGAQTRNPRDILQVYKREFSSVMSGARADVSPNSASNGYPAGGGSMIGLGAPWFTDPDYSGSLTAAGGPPPGWLGGAGGVALADEWPTTGSNNGPHFIRPVYPLLDDIFCRPQSLNTEYYQLLFAHNRVVGHRPGLRGKRMGSRWEILLCHGESGSLTSTPTYLRQVRLEFTYEAVGNSALPRVTPPRRPRRSGVVPSRGGRPMLVSIVSGSVDPLYITPYLVDFTANGVYVDVGYEAESFRTIGLSSDSGSLLSGDFAVYTTGSLVSADTASYDRATVASVFDPVVPFSSPQNLSSLIRSSEITETTEATARRMLSGTL